MAKKYFCTYPGYVLNFRYEGMRKDKQYEYPVEKCVEMNVTHIDEVEGDYKKRTRLGYVDENPRKMDPSFKGGALESSPSFQVPITPKTLRWISTPEMDCPDIVTAFLMSVKPTDRKAMLPNTEEHGFLCSIAGQISNDFLCINVPDGTPDSFPDDVTVPESLMRVQEKNLGASTKVNTKKKVTA